MHYVILHTYQGFSTFYNESNKNMPITKIIKEKSFCFFIFN